MSERNSGKLVAIMARLRSPEGCPWDRDQNFDTIKPYTLEETYELLEAIDHQTYSYGSLMRDLQVPRDPSRPVTFLFNVVLLEAATIPWLIGGVLVLYGSNGGYYWLAVGIILAFIKAVTDAWVLLVEINR